MEFSLVFDRKKKCKTKNDTAFVELRAYHNKIAKYSTTKISVKKCEWNENAENKISNKNRDHEALNYKLDSLLTGLRKAKLEKKLKDREFTFDDVRCFIKKRTNKTESFFDFVLNELDNDMLLSKKTKRQHKNTLGHLKSFAQKDVSFSDFTFDFLDKFLNYLRSKAYKVNTIHKHHKNLKKYLDLAIKKDYTDIKNPCKDLKVKSEQKPRDVLSIQEITKIRSLTFEEYENKISLVRDMFLFACYTGLRISDVMALKTSYVKREPAGILLDFYTQKVNKRAELPLYDLFPVEGSESLPELILENHIQSESEYVFKRISEPYINRHLKYIALKAGIDINLTFHVARESFGTIMANKVNPTILKMLLQHSDLRTTMRYVHHDLKTVGEQLRKVNDWTN